MDREPSVSLLVGTIQKFVSLQIFDQKKLEPSNMVPHCTIGGTTKSSKTSGKMADNKTALKKVLFYTT